MVKKFNKKKSKKKFKNLLLIEFIMGLAWKND
jgi:hypothetical protein